MSRSSKEIDEIIDRVLVEELHESDEEDACFERVSKEEKKGDAPKVEETKTLSFIKAEVANLCKKHPKSRLAKRLRTQSIGRVQEDQRTVHYYFSSAIATSHIEKDTPKERHFLYEPEKDDDVDVEPPEDDHL